jgi:hypothetical protein
MSAPIASYKQTKKFIENYDVHQHTKKKMFLIQEFQKIWPNIKYFTTQTMF